MKLNGFRPVHPEQIQLVVTDVDGVWTDGKLYLDDDGKESKAYSVYDGLGVVLGRNAGIAFAILSARRSPSVFLRGRQVGVAVIVQGSRDKGIDFLGICRQLGVAPSQTLYMGDDLPDFSAFSRAGLTVSVPQAPEIIRRQVDAITEASGGQGAIREVVEWLLNSRTASMVTDGCL